MAKLTEKQRETLGAIRDGVVFEINTGYGSWRIFGASPTVVGRLGAMGMAIKSKYDERKYRFDLTDAGRAAISDKGGADGAEG